MKLTHLNPDFDKFRTTPSLRHHIIWRLQEAPSIRKHNCEYPDLFWFFWYSKTTAGTLLRKAIKNMAHEDFEPSLENAFFLFEHNDVYIVEHRGTRRLVSQPKNHLSIFENLKRYVLLRREYMLHGERLNCPAHLSESLPCLWHAGYYNYVSKKIHELSKPPKAGDGIYISEESIEEVEVKYTASGGVRQTFSPAQLHSKFFVLSVDSEVLDRASRLLASSGDALVSIDLYECGSRFADALREEVRAKEARAGTGRYEMSNMIEKIETNTLYEQKDTMNVKL